MTRQNLIEATTDEFAMRIIMDTLLKHTTEKQLLDVLLKEEAALKTELGVKRSAAGVGSTFASSTSTEQPTMEQLNEITFLQNRVRVLQYTIGKLQRIVEREESINA